MNATLDTSVMERGLDILNLCSDDLRQLLSHNMARSQIKEVSIKCIKEIIIKGENDKEAALSLLKRLGGIVKQYDREVDLKDVLECIDYILGNNRYHEDKVKAIAQITDRANKLIKNLGAEDVKIIEYVMTACMQYKLKYES